MIIIGSQTAEYITEVQIDLLKCVWSEQVKPRHRPLSKTNECDVEVVTFWICIIFMNFPYLLFDLLRQISPFIYLFSTFRGALCFFFVCEVDGLGL